MLLNPSINCVLRGGCDLEQAAHYLKYVNINIFPEFTYPVIGSNYTFDKIINVDHSHVLRSSHLYNNEQKHYLARVLPFYDMRMYETRLFDPDIHVAVYSVVSDYTVAAYRFKHDHQLKFIYGNSLFPLTDESKQKEVIELSEGRLDSHFLAWCRNHLDYLGTISEDEFYENLAWIRTKMPTKTLLIFINGSEVEIEGAKEKNIHLKCKQMNRVLQKFVNKTPNTMLLNVNKLIQNRSNHTDGRVHFNRVVSKKIASEILDILESYFAFTGVIDKKESRKTRILELITPDHKQLLTVDPNVLDKDFRTHT